MTLPSRIGFGVSGPHGTPLVSRAATVTLVREAVDLGVRVFDSAPAYGAGEAERRLGTALETINRESVHVSTKAGLTSSGLGTRHRDFSPEAIEQSVKSSLARLKLEGVDTLYLHGPDPAELTSALFQRLASLQSAGTFARLGVAGRGSELSAAIETGRFQVLMAPVHPFLSQAEDQRLIDAANAGLDVVAIETSGDAPAPMPWPRRPQDIYRLAKALRAPSGRGRISAEEGLEAALQRGEVSCALMTTTRPAHLASNARLGEA